MERTKSKSKACFSSANVVAAMFSILLLLGLSYNHAGAASATPDLKLNGMDDMTTLTTYSSLTATVQMDAGDQTGEPADWWIAAETPMGWFYYQYPGGWYWGGDNMDDLSPAYQGPLFTMTEAMEVLRITGLQAGPYAFYFGMDTTVNSLVDGALSYDRIAFEIVEKSNYSFPLVDTNQGLCYDNSELIDCPAEGEAFYGQDAQYTGTTPSYTDNGDGTITDNVTGLIWTQDLSNYSMPWSAASSYCESLTTGGYTDWRLPTVKELWSIRDFSQGWPWVDTDYFYLVGDGSDQRQHHSWTSNPYLVESEYQNEQVIGDPAWIVNDWTGHIKAMSGNRFVRAVRGNTTYGINDFVDNGDGTVTDKATGLMWSQDDNGEALYWEDALAYAENATIAGYDDWRLPNIKELQSIADYSGAFPAMDTSVFNLTEVTNIVYDSETGDEIGTQVNYPFYWSSTSNPIEGDGEDVDGGTIYAWFLSSGYNTDPDGYDLHGAGSICFGAKSEENAGVENSVELMVRLVRGGNVTETPDGDPSCIDEDRVVSFPDGDTGGPPEDGPPEDGPPEDGPPEDGPPEG